MSIFTIIINLFLFLLIATAFVFLIKVFIRSISNKEREYNMVFLKVVIPKKESKEDRETDQASLSGQKDFKEFIGIASHFFESIGAIYESGVKSFFKGQDFFSLEYAVIENQIHFYFVVPRSLQLLFEKQITSFYPDVFVEQVPDYNIFKEDFHISACTLQLSKDFIYPIKTYEHLNTDPLNNITNILSKLSFEDGASIQIMLRPVKSYWHKRGREEAKNIFSNKKTKSSFLNPINFLSTLFDFFVKGDISKSDLSSEDGTKTTPLTDEEVKALEKKNSQFGFDSIIRIVTSSSSMRESKVHLANIKSAFVQYSASNANSFTTKNISKKKIVKNYILRNFKKPFFQQIFNKLNILSADEIASIFHLPNIQFNKAPTIAWLNYKIAPAPHNIPKEGILLGYNHYRGETKEIRMKNSDRFRHFYVIGQTGTGKSSILQVMIRQDLKLGHGLAVVDPHGSLVEDILPFIPRERADDVIYFNPADQERPLGMNLLEGKTWEEKEYVALEAMNIMIKLFNEEIFGPRIQDYFRNGCLTLMSDPEGGAITDIVRLFTDEEYQKLKVEHVKNPIVRSFWEHQMAQTGAREKSEMIPYFAAKFGQFVTNSLMRNIIGQTQSAFDFAEVMNNNKILLINLSKGSVGEINSKLLGLIIVSKIQMGALARQNLPVEQRKDFFLYIDEFQNYITDSIEIILSEARKYRLSLNMAHQYIAQLEGSDGKSKVKDAVFGNVGSMMCYKIGAQDAEYIEKEMSPVFTAQDLINIDKFKAVMKLSIDTQPSRPFSITPVNPYLEKGDAEAAEAFKQLSRLKYGRDREFVDREILRRVGAIF